MMRKLIENLINSGLTENEIVSRLKDIGVQTTQPTINRIKTGSIAKVSYDVGTAIVALHAKVCRKGKAA